MGRNPVCFNNSSLSNPAGIRDHETPMNQSFMGGNHTCADAAAPVDLEKKRYRHLTCLQLFSMIAVALFLIAVFAFGASALKDVRNELRSLETDVQDLRNDLNKMRHTLHPEAYSQADFALDVQGGHVVHDLSSRTLAAFKNSMQYKANAPWLRFKTPSSVIRGQTPPLTPGHCWPFEGESGKLFITLGHTIQVTHVSLGHISKEQSPMGQTLSAPKRFTVHGLKNLNGDETRLGTFEYDDNSDAIQTFKILDHTDEVFQYVKLEVESNYGNPFFTCLYNFKVHGQMP